MENVRKTLTFSKEEGLLKVLEMEICLKYGNLSILARRSLAIKEMGIQISSRQLA